MAVEVREAGPADAEAVRDVHMASVELARSDYDDDVVDAWGHDRDPGAYPIGSDDAYLVVAERDGNVVGFGELRPDAGDYIEADVAGEIRAVYVHPDAAREGVGSAIYRELETRARALGVPSLGLWASLNAVEFYQRHGFERVGEHTHEFGEEVPATAVEMRKDLDDRRLSEPSSRR